MEKENITKEMLKEMVYHTPLALNLLSEREHIDFINKALPYSTGFEVESFPKTSCDIANFKSIPYIMEAKYGKEDGGEFKFRVPNGIAGIICVYNITEQLKYNCELNRGGSIHYHIDMTDCFEKVTPSFVEENKEWILEELDEWGDDLDEKSRNCMINSRCWVQFQSKYKTAEFRVGEITFDYEIIIQRIIHCNRIVKKLKDKLIGNMSFYHIKYKEFDNDIISSYIGNNLKDLTDKIIEMKEKLRSLNQVDKNDLDSLRVIQKNIIQSRIIKI